MRVWSGRTESNCRHEFPGLGCLRYTTPRREVKRKKDKGKSMVRAKARFDFLLLPFALILVRQVRLELTIPCLRGRCLDPIWLLTHGGTERTRTVIGLIDNQVPHLSATVPNEELAARVGFEPTFA